MAASANRLRQQQEGIDEVEPLRRSFAQGRAAAGTNSANPHSAP
jgi:hypothetical protein